MFDAIIDFARENGVYGLMLLAFTESFISPILPDILMVPLCLAEPQNAIYYSGMTTLASIVGGFVGYSMGARLGPVCVNRVVPQHHWERIRSLAERHGAWTVFWGALMPIPYKFVSISAGVLGLNRNLFLLITVLGRSKRFLLEGILLYYYGAAILEVWARYEHYGVWLVAAGVVAAAVYLLVRRRRRQTDEDEGCTDKQH